MAIRSKPARAKLYAAVVLTALASSLAACSLLAGLTEDYHFAGDASATGADGNATGDASVGPGTDGSATDGSGIEDAKPDNLLADGAPAPFCETVDATGGFCDDFESTSATPPDGWTQFVSDGTIDAGVSLSDDGGVGRDHIVHFRYEQGAGTTHSAWLSRAFPSAAADSYVHYEVEFDYWLESAGIYSCGLGELTFPTPGVELGICQYRTGGTISELGTEGMTTAAEPKKWQHAKILLARDGGVAAFSESVTVTNSSGMNAAVDVKAAVLAGSSPDVEVRLGVFSTAAGAGTVSVRFDNVVVRRW